MNSVNKDGFISQGPAGALHFIHVRDTDTGNLYSELPVSFDTPGVTVLARVGGDNTLGVQQYMKIKVWFVDPLGTIRGQRESDWVDVWPGFRVTERTEWTTLDVAGNWFVHAELYAQIKTNGPGAGVLVDSDQWHTLIVGDGEPPNGEPSEGLLKWVLIGGGIILVSAFVIRPLIRRK